MSYLLLFFFYKFKHKILLVTHTKKDIEPENVSNAYCFTFVNFVLNLIKIKVSAYIISFGLNEDILM